MNSCPIIFAKTAKKLFGINRSNGFQNFVLKSVMVEKEVLPIISQCLDGMEKCAEEINTTEVRPDTEQSCLLPFLRKKISEILSIFLVKAFPGVDVMITNFCDVCQLPAKNWRLF
jgi:hypothetical protein